MERKIEFYRSLIRKMRCFLMKHYSEPDITIITCLLDAYHSSMECAYSEYNKTSFVSKLRWKKRLAKQFRNLQQFYLRYIVSALWWTRSICQSTVFIKNMLWIYENLKSIGTKFFQIQKRFPKGSCIFICKIKSWRKNTWDAKLLLMNIYINEKNIN